MLTNPLPPKSQPLCRFIQLAAAVGCLALVSCDRAAQPVDQSVGQPAAQPVVEPDLHQAFEDTCRGTGRPAEAFQIVDRRDWERGTVVLYEGVCGPAETPEAPEAPKAPEAPAATSPLFVNGYTVLVRQGPTLRPSSSGSMMSETQTLESAQPITYTIGYAPDDGYAIVEGLVLDPEVAVIEARFDNDLVLQDAAEQDRFAIVAAGASKLCDLRVLGSNQQPIGEPLVSNDCGPSL